MKLKTKFTTIALNDNQHLVRFVTMADNKHEAYLIGYTGGKRDKSLDGFYFRNDLKVK